MNEKNDFALVLRPPSAVEKAEAGANRVLSGMVVDTLALAKNTPSTKTAFTVLMCDDQVSDAVEMMIKFDLEQRYELKFFRFKRATELLTLATGRSFDLVFLYLGNVEWDVGSGVRFSGAIEVLQNLKTQFGKTIIATQGMDLSKQFKDTGITFMGAPFTLETFRNALKPSLETSHKRIHEQ